MSVTYRRNPDWLWPLVTGTAGKVWCALATFAMDKNECWPSIASIAERAQIDERAVRRGLEKLKKLNAISIKHTGRTNLYTLHFDGPREDKSEQSDRTKSSSQSGENSQDRAAKSVGSDRRKVSPEGEKEKETKEREREKDTPGQPDELKTLRVTHESPPVKFKPASKAEPELNTFGDAFDATPTEPPAENARVKSLTGYVFALFATKAPAAQNRIAKMRAANPPRHEADIVQSVIAKDPSLTRNEISDLFEFATTHERYWRAAANEPVKFAKNLSRIATDFASDQPVRR